MKYWKCKTCFREKETKDNIIMCICNSCMIEMQRFPDTRKYKIEVENGDSISKF